ncbi:MAG: rod shape-determining protein MreD [Calditrichaceae bacterium]
MNQELKYFIFIFIAFGISSVVLQSVFVPFIELNVWRPDLVLVVVLLTGKRFGSVGGSTSGFLLGILQDALTSMPIGISALPKAVAGYASGKIKAVRLEGAVYYLMYVVLIFLHEVIYYLFIQFKIDISFTELIYSRVFPNTIYTTLMLIFVNLFAQKYFTE